MNPSKPLPSLDVIIPLFNEQESLPILLPYLENVFTPENLLKHRIGMVRYIFVDDGSKDKSYEILKDFVNTNSRISLIRLSRNFGHQNALAAGLEKSDGDLTAIIDADLQDPPEVILQMVDKWREGYEVVYGIRQKRKENWLKKACYWIYYRLLYLLSEIDIPKDSGDFCLMDRVVIDALLSLPEKLRFSRGLRAWVGFRQTGLKYERQKRNAGISKYPFKDLYRLATDGIISLSLRPLKVVQIFAFSFAFFFLLMLTGTIFWAVTLHKFGIEMWFLLSFTFLSLIGFTVLLSLYVISGYLGRMFFEVKSRPSYLIMEELNSGTQSNRKDHQQVISLKKVQAGKFRT